MGKDYTDVAGYDLSKLMQNCGTTVYGTNYYLYRLVTEACAIVDAPQSFVQSVIKNLTDLYKMGEVRIFGAVTAHLPTTWARS